MSRAMQFILVERSSYRFSAIILEISYGIDTLYFNDLKHLDGPILRVTLFQRLLVLAHAYRVTYFSSSPIFIALYTVAKNISATAELYQRVAYRFEHCNLTGDVVTGRSTCNFP